MKTLITTIEEALEEQNTHHADIAEGCRNAQSIRWAYESMVKTEFRIRMLTALRDCISGGLLSENATDRDANQYVKDELALYTLKTFSLVSSTCPLTSAESHFQYGVLKGMMSMGLSELTFVN